MSGKPSYLIRPSLKRANSIANKWGEPQAELNVSFEEVKNETEIKQSFKSAVKLSDILVQLKT